MIIAYDIETCPQPDEALSPAQRRRLERLLAAETRRLGPPADAAEADERARKARALHPALCWICCLTVQRGPASNTTRPPRTYAAATPAEEADLLRAFWDDLARLGNRRVTWVTFNGKGFDAEVLLTRTLRWGLTPTRTDLLDRYPYNHRPHCDLSTLWRRSAMRLDDVCDLLGVPSPKNDLDGGGVGAAVAAGRLDDVVRYNQADVAATLACYDLMRPALG